MYSSRTGLPQSFSGHVVGERVGCYLPVSKALTLESGA